MDMNHETELLHNFERDSKWFHENINKLREEGFTDKFVAVKDTRPIASGKDIKLVIKEIESKNQNPAYIFIEFVHPEGTIIIL
ncbi:MAG: DUF5678 domain-containing protein [Nanoarchaeota archaeon]